MFHVGQKVVCINDAFIPNRVASGTILPVKGRVYTIRGAFAYSLGPVCYLEEIRNFVYYLNTDTGEMVEPAFPEMRFRPLVQGKAEISFTTGADPESEKLDNRVRRKVRA